MAATFSLRIAVIGFLLVAASVSVQASTPIVYEDEYVTVRAGLLESGNRAVHLGDPLSLIINVVFDAQQVQIENLDDAVFQRVFSAMPGIRLHAPTTVTTNKESGNRVQVTGHWRLQVLACPNELTSCPGPRSYELPMMTVAYQLIDDAGGSTDGRAARFRPWPGKIDVAPAVAVTPEPGATITDILPGGAYDSPQPVAELAPARSTLLAAGVLLLVTGFLANKRERRPLAVRSHDRNARWEHTLVRLTNDTISDDEWSDLLRRCVTWYCMDELGRNPYAWLGATASDAASGTDSPSGLREFFLDVLHQESIDPSRRADFLDRLLGVTGRERDAATAESPQ